MRTDKLTKMALLLNKIRRFPVRSKSNWLERSFLVISLIVNQFIGLSAHGQSADPNTTLLETEAAKAASEKEHN
jgi:hypothetical protein